MADTNTAIEIDVVVIYLDRYAGEFNYLLGNNCGIAFILDKVQVDGKLIFTHPAKGIVTPDDRLQPVAEGD